MWHLRFMTKDGRKGSVEISGALADELRAKLEAVPSIDGKDTFCAVNEETGEALYLTVRDLYYAHLEPVHE